MSVTDFWVWLFFWSVDLTSNESWLFVFSSKTIYSPVAIGASLTGLIVKLTVPSDENSPSETLKLKLSEHYN